MDVFREVRRSTQRPGGSPAEGNLVAGQEGKESLGVHRSLVDGDVAEDRGDQIDRELGRGDGKEQRGSIIDPRIGIDNQVLHLVHSFWARVWGESKAIVFGASAVSPSSAPS